MNYWIHTFLKGISAMWNAISLVQDFELVSPCPFTTTITITPRAFNMHKFYLNTVKWFQASLGNTDLM